MKKLAVLAFVTMFAVGCSKKEASCDDVFDHTKSLAPAEMHDMLEKNRTSAIEKCNKLSKEARQCALDAKSMEALQKCPRT